MHMDPMVNDKKMAALKALIKAMFEMESEGDGDKAIDPSEALHEASESPEEEEAEHMGGVSEAEENAMEKPDFLKDEMANFMKQSRKVPSKGRTKAVIMATRAEKPAMKFGGK